MSRGSGTVVRGTVEYRNTAEPCEDMPRKSLDIRFTDYPVPQKRGLLRPFPAFRRGRVRAEPANGSRDESLVGFGATPQGLKTINICNFQGSLEPVFSAQFFHRLLDTTHLPVHRAFDILCTWYRSPSTPRPFLALLFSRPPKPEFHPHFECWTAGVQS